MTRGAGSPIAGFLVHAGRRVISLACGRRFRVLACVAPNPLLGCLLGLLLFALALQDRLLAFPRHDGLPAAPALTASATASGLGPSLVDVERPPVEVLPVERIDGGARRAVRHGHEAEAARPPGVPVGDHRDLLDIAVRGERVAKRIFIGVKAQVSYVDLQGNISKHVRVTAGLAPAVSPSFTTHEAVIKGRLAAACRGNNLSLRLPAVATRPSVSRFAMCSRARGFGCPIGVALSARTPPIVSSIRLVIGRACGVVCGRVDSV